MKKMIIIATLAVFTLGANAQKAFKKQVELATTYAQLAKEKFDLSAEAQTKVFETKKEQFVELNTKLKPMKAAGKSAEQIKAVQKKINTAYAEKYTEIIGCNKKEFFSFNKEFITKMKALREQ